jgi:hypothetical protein
MLLSHTFNFMFTHCNYPVLGNSTEEVYKLWCKDNAQQKEMTVEYVLYQMNMMLDTVHCHIHKILFLDCTPIFM